MAETNQTPEASAYTSLGTARTEKVVLPEATFDGVINVPVMHKAVTAFLANQRQGNASTKIRKYVTGGNQKPWKQKGTGRARQGSSRAPQWVGGGKVFTPKPRDFEYAMPKKAVAVALRSALSLRAKESRIVVVDQLALKAIKTKTVATALSKLGAPSALIVDEKNENLAKSTRNLPKAKFLRSEGVNVYDVLDHETLVLSQ